MFCFQGNAKEGYKEVGGENLGKPSHPEASNLNVDWLPALYGLFVHTGEYLHLTRDPSRPTTQAVIWV